MATYEGKWRCLRCSSANLGRNLNCLTCGVKRGDDVTTDEKTTSGTDFNPQWAAVQTDNLRMRIGRRTENYNLLCKELGGDNKLHKIKLATENWSKFKNGDRLHGKTNLIGDLVSIDELPDGKW